MITTSMNTATEEVRPAITFKTSGGRSKLLEYVGQRLSVFGRISAFDYDLGRVAVEHIRRTKSIHQELTDHTWLRMQPVKSWRCGDHVS